MRTDRKRGSALLTVLWLSAALAAIAFSVSSSVRAETDRVEAASNGLRAWYLATGAVERGIQWMAWGDSVRNEDGTARFWQYDAPRMNMNFPSGTAVVEMIPESSKLSVNEAGIDDLTKVITAVGGDAGQAREIAGAILDWRGGSQGTSPNDQYYFGISPTFRARHASFEEIEELLFVRGMTPELFYGTFVADERVKGRAVRQRRPARLPFRLGVDGAFRREYDQSAADGRHRRAAGRHYRDRHAARSAAV